jgi:hypothetical protein
MYLHYTGWDIKNLDISQPLSTPSELSNYWKQKLLGKSTVSSDGVLAGLHGVLDGLVELSQDKQKVRPMVDGLKEMTGGLFSELIPHGKYASGLFKEYVFEEVRAEHFSELPSRKRCMFLFEDNMNPDTYLQSMGFELNIGNLIEVHPIGDHKVIRCKISLLNCDMKKYDELVEVAHEYWSGTEEQSEDVEVLFEGNFSIVPYAPPTTSQNT